MDQKKMSERQRLFIKFYIDGHNAASAARKAGYSGASATTTGYKLLKRADIRAEIARLEQKVADSVDSTRILSAIEVRQRLSEIADTADKPQDRIRALELLGKIMGMFVDRSEVLSIEATPDNIKALTDSDLRRLIDNATDITPNTELLD